MPAVSGSIFDDNDPRENEVHPELQRLPALSLRGTFSKAYALLIRIVSRVGWDELLKYRSNVFVMEEEYRIHRALVEDKDEPMSPVERVELAKKPPVAKLAPDASEAEDHSPMERISLDSDRGSEKSPAVSSAKDTSPSKGSLNIDELLRKAGGGPRPASSEDDLSARGPGWRESEYQNPLEAGVNVAYPPQNPRAQRHSVSFSFKNKRLCEKWLDNLFMILYTDLRLYTALKQEVSQFKNQAGANANVLLFRKTGAEWEIYGDLAERLEHKDDAKEAYKLCLDQKFSVKSWLKLLEMNADEGNIQQTLTAVVKLVTLLDRAYVEATYPSPIARGVFKIIRRHGLAKVQNALISMNIPKRNFQLVTRYFEYAELFSVAGSTW
ncbi:Chs5p-Arf1p-binding proteins-domain-containing protein [Blyttiomyces helicus]|uniref:Chs5p-Arf1p-binding proteins-domain-containing protein n=1 Tax=Blyttiomyces helicus TaxID=388810 RepID=A0A4P9VV49_9FUNG|nr:Chs5p-Arf1p-binding proteins-domain-containing protein [Blyttiomyces helicus]|eukprot:RKO83501.1 Chs5p-Arf1p-binding proteins-domain-containing protein [Blyttiomyces helicus]